jgi:hypothetical protein
VKYLESLQTFPNSKILLKQLKYKASFAATYRLICQSVEFATTIQMKNLLDTIIPGTIQKALTYTVIIATSLGQNLVDRS